MIEEWDLKFVCTDRTEVKHSPTVSLWLGIKRNFSKTENMARFLSEDGPALHMTGKPTKRQPSLKSASTVKSSPPSQLTVAVPRALPQSILLRLGCFRDRHLPRTNNTGLDARQEQFPVQLTFVLQGKEL